MALAQELVQGVDVWLNTPRRPWEASGTSGMKVLANGGLNEGSRMSFSVQVYLGEVDPQWVQVELCAEPANHGVLIREAMDRGEEIPGAINGYVYRATLPTSRPPAHFTPRVIPTHPAAGVLLEEHHILWY